MDERVDAIEKGHDRRVVAEEIALKVRFHDGEHPSKDRFVLEPENALAMSLGNFHHTLLGRSQPLRSCFRHGVEEIVDRPVEHLDQEGKFVQDSTVDVTGPARRVWRGDGYATDPICLAGTG